MTKRSTASSYFAASPLATAIDVKFLAGDETALRGKQIKRGVRDVSDIGTERHRLSFDRSPIEGRAVALIVPPPATISPQHPIRCQEWFARRTRSLTRLSFVKARRLTDGRSLLYETLTAKRANLPRL